MNMRIIGLLSLVILMASSCNKDRVRGSGSIKTEERTVNSFTQVEIHGSSEVDVKKGTAFKVEVTGYENLLPYFETKVANGRLTVAYKKDVNVRHDNMRVSVTLPVLNGLFIDGSGELTTTGDFNNNLNFEARISGSGDISIEKGAAENFSSDISGSGKIDAFGLSAKNAKVEISGSGETNITAATKLDVKISGSGKVYYKGSPAVTTKINGSGAVVKE